MAGSPFTTVLELSRGMASASTSVAPAAVHRYVTLRLPDDPVLAPGRASLRHDFTDPDSGLGLSRKAQAALRAMRKVESLTKLWEVSPLDGFLAGRENNEAYAAGKPGQQYIVYFTDGGAVGLDCGPAVHRAVDRGEYR